MTMFNYNKNVDVKFNDVIDEVVSMAKFDLAGNTYDNRDKKVSDLNYLIGEYVTKDTKVEGIFEAEGLNAFKNPKVQKNRDVKDNFDAVIAEMLNPIFPMVTNNDFVRFMAEVHQVGFGDTARFIIDSNELYKVNEIAEGVGRGVLEPIHKNEITINASPVEVAYEIDFYQFAAGAEDFADKAIRVAKSFEQYIFLKVLNAMSTVTSQLGSAYSATGFTNSNWTALAQKVGAANGGVQVFAMGTLNALSQVIPSTAGLQYGLGQKIADQGYLDKYMGTRLVVLDQALQYGTVNTTATFAVPDNTIYFLGVPSRSVIQIVYEGDSFTAEQDASVTVDNTYRMRVGFRVGVGITLGSKVGTLTLN